MELSELPALRLSVAMRRLLLEPVDKTLGGALVVSRWPVRANWALLRRRIIDNSNRLTPYGVEVRDALLRRRAERRRLGLDRG